MRYAAITGWGMAVPKQVLSNADLEKMVDTSDEWILSRTGIRERRIVGPNDSTTSLSVAAATQALTGARSTRPRNFVVWIGSRMMTGAPILTASEMA